MNIPSFVVDIQQIIIKKQRIRTQYNALVKVITEDGKEFFVQKQGSDEFVTGVDTLIKDIKKLSDLSLELEDLDLLLIATIESNLCDCNIAFTTPQYTDHAGEVHTSKECVFVPRSGLEQNLIEVTPGDLIYFRTLKKLIPTAHIEPKTKEE